MIAISRGRVRIEASDKRIAQPDGRLVADTLAPTLLWQKTVLRPRPGVRTG